MTKRVAIACALGLFAAACAPSASTQTSASVAPAAAQGGCAGFSTALRACAPARCAHPHPLVPTFTIEHRIAGMEDGACAYTQTVPGDMTMRCRFSEAGRSEFAEEINAMVSGRQTTFSFSTSDPQDTVVTRECVVLDAAGREIPWGVSQR
ncbi:MAG: hypothetical protein R3C16_10585 [Hyphomonadaceae bacterium]